MSNSIGEAQKRFDEVHERFIEAQKRQDEAQKRFDDTYISSSEIMQRLGVSRTGLLYARKRGLLPDAIVVNDGQLFLWERDTVQRYLEAWKLILDVRRGVAA